MRVARLGSAAVIACLALTVSHGASRAAAGPHWIVESSGVKQTLAAISCPSRAECWAVGRGVVLRTINSGAQWSVVHVNLPNPNAWLNSIKCPPRGACFLVDPPRSVVVISRGGQSIRSTTVAPGVKSSYVGPIACPTATICYVHLQPKGTDAPGSIYKTTNAGKSWAKETIPKTIPCRDCGGPIGYPLSWISCSAAEICRAGGDYFNSHSGYDQATIGTDDGTHWTLRSAAGPEIASCATRSFCTGIDSAGVGNYLDRTANGGRSWRGQSIRPFYMAVACLGQNICELAGFGGDLAESTRTAIFRQKSPTKRTLRAIALPGRNTAYAVGGHGIIIARLG